jgi:hypothetical protein
MALSIERIPANPNIVRLSVGGNWNYKSLGNTKSVPAGVSESADLSAAAETVASLIN